MDKKIIGNWGEKVAKTYLENKGYVILETNWHYHHKELDIIAYKDQVVGLEIKTRTGKEDSGFAILKVEQVARLRLALKAYCRLHYQKYDEARLDLITIRIKNKNLAAIKHYPDI